MIPRIGSKLIARGPPLVEILNIRQIYWRLFGEDLRFFWLSTPTSASVVYLRMHINGKRPSCARKLQRDNTVLSYC